MPPCGPFLRPSLRIAGKGRIRSEKGATAAERAGSEVSLCPSHKMHTADLLLLGPLRPPLSNSLYEMVEHLLGLFR